MLVFSSEWVYFEDRNKKYFKASTGEEELQLQLALAMSKEEADQAVSMKSSQNTNEMSFQNGNF